MDKSSLSLKQFDEFDFRELPIGVYMTSLDGQFIVANKIMRQMLGLPLGGQLQANIVPFYVNPDERKVAINHAIKLANEGQHVARGALHLHVGNHDLFVEDYCRILEDENGKVIGFVGCMVDITSEHDSRKRERELQERVEELRFDIGRILHANTTTLVMVKQTLDAVVEAFEPKPYQDASSPSTEEVEILLTDFALGLANAIERFIQSADQDRRLKALSSARWEKLRSHIQFLREFKSRVLTPESYPATLRKLANDVGKIHSSIVHGTMPRDPMRELQNTAWQLERLTNLIEVLDTRTAVLQMDYTISSLREFITSDTREPVEHIRITVKSIIEECSKRLSEYARSLRIDIDRKEIDESIFVLVNHREMVRALSNLLHNAIKYSWRRDPDLSRAAWVSVRTKVKEQFVQIEFENWGVPIKHEEIETGKVFELGYRGEMAKDRGRLGTGIGLTDARHIAESHHGKLLIESHPANRNLYSDQHEKYYHQPFLTKVIMILPLA